MNNLVACLGLVICKLVKSFALKTLVMYSMLERQDMRRPYIEQPAFNINFEC